MKPIPEMLRREFPGHGVQVEWVDERRPWICKLRMGAETVEGPIRNPVDLNRAINGMARVEAECSSPAGVHRA